MTELKDYWVDKQSQTEYIRKRRKSQNNTYKYVSALKYT